MKSCKDVIFFSKGYPSTHIDNIPVYKTWPKLTHTDATKAKSWSNPKGFSVTMKNVFSDVLILNESQSRGYSSKIPQAVIYCPEKKCYLQFDFRYDGLAETLANHSISSGKIGCQMSFIFVGSNYYLYPTSSKKYKDFEKSFNKAAKPKSTMTTSKIGTPFLGAFDDHYVYLGKFKCTKDVDSKINYENSVVHVYLMVYSDAPFYDPNNTDIHLAINKTKMAVKKWTDKKHHYYQDMLDRYNDLFKQSSIVETRYYVKGSYGTLDIAELNSNNNTLVFKEPKPVNKNYCCGSKDIFDYLNMNKKSL